jgi:hypothetical protein
MNGLQRELYDRQRPWADKWIPRQCEIIGPLLLRKTSFDVDTKQAADLTLLKADGITIAARTRTRAYLDRFGPFQFTIRSHQPTGCKTELAKIKEGFADWMFYGFETEEGDDIDPWIIINLNSFRMAGERYDKGEIGLCFRENTNPDGTKFRWYDWRSFPEEPSLFIARSSYYRTSPEDDYIDSIAWPLESTRWRRSEAKGIQ